MSGAGVTLAGLSGEVHRFSHAAMATVFEIVCEHPDPQYARQAAWAAFDLTSRLEQELSRFIENSDISRINALAPGQTALVSRWTMECLQLARQAWTETSGAFDISLGSGLQTLDLDPQRLTVRANAGGVRIDLGGIGKGYAVDRMAEVLQEWDIHQALIHGGYSSVLALKAPPGCEGWPLTMSVREEASSTPFALIHARQRALSASGTRKGEHIIDPRTGQPVRSRPAAWASADVTALTEFCGKAGGLGGAAVNESPAAVAEVFSTAFLVLEPEEIAACCGKYPGLEAWIQEDGPGGKPSIRHFPARQLVL